MLKFIYVILMNLFRAPYMIPKMRHEADHPEKYSMEERYALCRHAIRLMKRTGGIHTKAYGTENLPAEGGYMMYPNHQGKYDALGIMDTHDRPCSLVMDKAKSNTILVKEFVDLVQGKRLDKKNVRQALSWQKKYQMVHAISYFQRADMILTTGIMSVTLKQAVLRLH